MPATDDPKPTGSKTNNNDAIIAAVRNRLDAELKAGYSRSDGGLYLVATPIGNLSDITLRALAVLATADVIYAEDTRHSAHLMQHFQIRTPLKSSHDHNEEHRIDEILDRLAQGQRVAIISDAGTPLISDPGYKIVRAATAAGHDVFSVPGPAALLAALISSGLPTNAFMFAGFLPTKQQARRRRLNELKDIPATLVFYESPNRISSSCLDMAETLGETRSGVIARELTKRYEEILRGTLGDLAAEVADRTLKGEIVVVVSPAFESPVTDDDIITELEAVLSDHSLKDGARMVAEKLQVSRSKVYELGLSLKRSSSS